MGEMYVFVFLISIIINIIGGVFGASMFLVVPFLQSFFPGISFGQIIGNAKSGSFLRSFGSVVATYKELQLKQIKIPILIFGLANIIGAFFIADLPQTYIFYIVCFGVILSEIAPKFSLNQKNQFLFCFFLGVYAGMFGAGVGIILLAIVRMYFPKDEESALAKMHVRAMELVGAAFALATHFLKGNLIFLIVISYGGGAFVGGYLGGKILKKIGKQSPKVQRVYLIAVYIIAITVALLALI